VACQGHQPQGQGHPPLCPPTQLNRDNLRANFSLGPLTASPADSKLNPQHLNLDSNLATTNHGFTLTHTHSHTPTMFLPTLARRLAQASRPEIAAAAAGRRPGSKLRTVWPPDFTTMTPQQQLRWEKKYKRRLGIANQQPRFDKAIRLIQLAVVGGGQTSVPFMDWNAD